MSDLTMQTFAIGSDDEFNAVCLNIFHHQATHCKVYKAYISNLGIDLSLINTIDQIPYLPIGFFKTQEVLSDTAKPEIIFSSSGTTGMTQSKHIVTDVSIYEDSFKKAFKLFYGDIEKTCMLALLPSYLERDGSSLIYMIDALISDSKNPDSGYFLRNHDELLAILKRQKAKKQKTILVGVTYALLDFLENHQIDFPELIVMETGGMKGKRKEMVREELHQIITSGFGVKSIHSEYGMTELLSQAYSEGDGIFKCPPWMKIKLRDTNDPLSLIKENKTGGINVIDLANINSCSFIATQDLGRLMRNGTFEVLGRFDNSDIRGCNLLIE